MLLLIYICKNAYLGDKFLDVKFLDQRICAFFLRFYLFMDMCIFKVSKFPAEAAPVATATNSVSEYPFSHASPPQHVIKYFYLLMFPAGVPGPLPFLQGLRSHQPSPH